MNRAQGMRSDTIAANDDHVWPDPRYAWYVTGLLMLLYMFSFVDRTIIVLLIEPIKRDLQLSDTEISLLYGFAFAVFYTFLGMPIARLADAKSRRSIIAIGVLIWSLMTCLCGVAKSFSALFLARMGVGVGEAALSPAAYSMIADYFPREMRARAMSVYTLGVFLGGGVALILGGMVIEWIDTLGSVVLPLVGELYSWQLAFIVVGLPGVVFFLLMCTVREPVRQGGGGDEVIPFREAMQWFALRWRFYASFCLTMACLVMYSYSLSAWAPSFFMRTFAWGTLEVSRYYGAVVLISGPTGILAGGWIASRRLSSGDDLANLRMAVWGSAALLLPAASMALLDNAWHCLALIALLNLIGGLPLGVAMAAIHEVTPNRLRAQAAAFYLFAINIVGLGLGPTLVAVLTDFLFEDPLALRYSLALVGVGACAAALILALYAIGQFGHLKRLGPALQ
ncbi:spinster family MFS transporter [Parahaliea mediterranea]|uniref:spinster family MFS transporter n=1 Tax=Parahaliea mediterranea TaxID=651086 RepID=UPI000E2E75B7|nr:MFS transporter [Parahaliea mediterranea]